MMMPPHRPETHTADVTRDGTTRRTIVWRDGSDWMSWKPVQGYYFHTDRNVKVVS